MKYQNVLKIIIIKAYLLMQLLLYFWRL